MIRRLRFAGVALLLGASAVPLPAGGPPAPGPTVLPCTGITLTASYLADMTPGGGGGFLFRIDNRTRKTVRLAEPVPSSAHWYAHVGKLWLWRASAGRGGALVNAIHERGPMFAYRPTAPPEHPEILVVPAHGSQTWTESMRDDPAIAYRPSCPMCSYPGESEYQAVFAYAYLPSPGESASDLLRCGLRSEPVPMPPVALHAAASSASH